MAMPIRTSFYASQRFRRPSACGAGFPHHFGPDRRLPGDEGRELFGRARPLDLANCVSGEVRLVNTHTMFRPAATFPLTKRC
jgi:hypothetical protein